MITDKPDILAIMDLEGIALRKRGRLWWACCPFHDEKTPSFAVNADRQKFNCYGCREHGDVIDLIMKLKRFSFKDALNYLGMSIGRLSPPDPTVERRRKIQRQYSEAITSLYDSLCQQSRELQNFKLRVKINLALTEAGAILFAQTMGTLAVIDYKLDILLEGTIEDQISLLKETKENDRKNIERRAA